MAKSLKKNYIYNLTYQILVMIVPLITTPYLSRVLGAESIGIYSYTLSITTYFILFGSLGVAMYGQREIAYVQEDIEKRSKVFYEILLMRFTTLGISIIIFYITFAMKGQYSVYYKILLLEIIANALDISWFFQGIEEFKKTVIRNTIVKVVSVMCIFTFVKSSNDLNKYFLIYVLSTFLGNISLWMYMPKYIERISIKELQIFRHLKPTVGLFVPQVAVQIYTVLDKTMIGAIVEDKSEVGFYEQAQKMIKLLITISTSLGTVMVPRMANTFARGDKKKLIEYINMSFRFVLILVFPVMFGMVSVANKFVPIFYGSGYEKVIILINIIVPIVLAIGLSNVIGTQYLLPTKKQKEYTISVTVGAFVNFILNMIFIRLWKSVGASIATVIAEFTVTGVQFYMIRKEIKFVDIIKLMKNYVVSGLIMLCISVIIGKIINNNIVSITIQILVAVLVYFTVLIVLKDEMIIDGVKIIKDKLKIVKCQRGNK